MLTSLLMIVVLVYAGWTAVLYVKQDQLLFPRQLAGPGGPPDTFPRGITRVWLPIDDPAGRVVQEQPSGGSVEAWVYWPEGVRPGEKGLPAVVFAHGNGELIDDMFDYARQWTSRGFAVIMPEYRGYGRSKGEPSEAALVADYQKFVAWMLAQPGVDPDRVVYHGRSLGTGVVSQVAAARVREGQPAPTAIVLESPFVSVASMANRFGVPGFVVRNPFRTDAVLPGLAGKGTRVLILHSPADEIVPYAHGKRLAAMTPGAKLVDLAGSHISNLMGLPAYWTGIDELFTETEQNPTSNKQP